MDRTRVVDVAIDPRAGGSEAIYTYQAGNEVGLGDAVIVPLGSRTILGFVTRVHEVTETELGFPFTSLKAVAARVEGLSVPEPVVELSEFVAQETLSPLMVALGPATPPGVRDRIVTSWTKLAHEETFSLNSEQDEPLTVLQREVLRVLDDKGGTLTDGITKKLPATYLKALRGLTARGWVTESLRVQLYAERRRSEAMLALTADANAIETFLKREGKKRPAQALVLMRLQGHEDGAFTVSEIKALAGVTETTVKALIDAGLLVKVDPEAPRSSNPPTPNPAQQIAIDAIVDAIQTHEHRAFLLYGVTGSGKTEVYLRTAAEAIRSGRQVLYLVPEIALAAQAISQLRERFGRTVAVLHSDLSDSERLQSWMRICNGEAAVVLGARSALFAPLTNLGLVVVDEEHEASYKQESAPRYHAKSLALWLGRHHKCPVVLGSATPSLESFYEAELGEREERGLTLLSLPARAASAKLPTVHITDLAEGYRSNRPAILTPDLQERLEATLQRGEQAILFLNRRAYAAFLICRDCGYQMVCPNCTVSLSFHRQDMRLRCHHCGYNQRPPDECPSCHGLRLSPFGIGTEKVEESIAALFPQANVARLDRDVARKKGALEDTLAGFRSGDIQVLVGTQMVAKGLDFPNVTLVGVIAADVSLNIPDFRSSERTFQLLAQVAGRAGRGQAAGQVVIQTFNPQHIAIQTAAEHDYLKLYEVIKQERSEARYPPFCRLVNVVCSGESHSAVLSTSIEAARRLDNPAWTLLGPADCPMERIQGKWRRHLLIKLPVGGSAHPIAVALEGLHPKGVQIVVDVDPYSLM